MHETTHVYGTTTLVRYSFQHFLNLFRLFMCAQDKYLGPFFSALSGGTGRCKQSCVMLLQWPSRLDRWTLLQRFGLTKQCPKTKREGKKSIKYCVDILLVVYLYNFLLSCVQSSEFSVQKDHGVHELVAVWQMYCGCLILNVHAWFLEKAQGNLCQR